LLVWDLARADDAKSLAGQSSSHEPSVVDLRVERRIIDRLRPSYDLQTGKALSASFGSQRYGSEPVFVPRASARDEDDGYVMTMITDAAKGSGELLVMDAQTLETAARIEIPMRLPLGFHAAYLPH
jgi:carotenoid cleavage dioxygenase-like enzyme